MKVVRNFSIGSVPSMIAMDDRKHVNCIGAKQTWSTATLAAIVPTLLFVTT